MTPPRLPGAARMVRCPPGGLAWLGIGPSSHDGPTPPRFAQFAAPEGLAEMPAHALTPTPPPTSRNRKPNLALRQSGFTLVEVMVALAICAIALTAGMKAMQALTNNAERQGNAVLGNLCADNALSDMRITGLYPDVGDNTIACPQAGRDFQVRLTVRPTPNPSFRRVDAEVFLAGQPVVQEVTLVGRY